MFYSLCFRHKEAAKFLLKANQWNDAHKLIIQHISAKAIINGLYEFNISEFASSVIFRVLQDPLTAGPGQDCKHSPSTLVIVMGSVFD